MAKRNPKGHSNSIPSGSAVAEFNNYSEAIDYVDRIVLGDFPATSVAIVGTDLKTVERVRGRISYAKVAFSGATAGVWIGLIAFVLFGTAPTQPGQVAPEPLFTLGSAIFVGAGFGMLIQVIRFSLSKTKRNFASSSQVVASKYEVIVPSELVNQATEAYVKGGQAQG